MARLAARWRRSNLVKLVTPRKGNHPNEAKIRSRKKAFYRRERDSFEGRHEEAEIQRKTLRRGKNLALSKDTCLEKKRVRSKVTPRKLGVGLKRRGQLNKKRWGWRLAWWRSTEKKEASHLLRLRVRHQYSDQLSSRIRAPCMAPTTAETEVEEDQMSRSSA